MTLLWVVKDTKYFPGGDERQRAFLEEEQQSQGTGQILVVGEHVCTSACLGKQGVGAGQIDFGGELQEVEVVSLNLTRYCDQQVNLSTISFQIL